MLQNIRQLFSLIAVGLVSSFAFCLLSFGSLVVGSTAGAVEISPLPSALFVLPIKDIQVIRQGNTIQVEVTIPAFQACKYNFKGLWPELIASGQGQSRYRVTAFASEIASGTCDDLPADRIQVLILRDVGPDRYDFIAASMPNK